MANCWNCGWPVSPDGGSCPNCFQSNPAPVEGQKRQSEGSSVGVAALPDSGFMRLLIGIGAVVGIVVTLWYYYANIPFEWSVLGLIARGVCTTALIVFGGAFGACVVAFAMYLIGCWRTLFMVPGHLMRTKDRVK